jgi:hypothetical protein
MKFWLIIFFLNPQSEFLDKREFQYTSKIECQKAQARLKKLPVVKQIQTICVSDDHHSGRKQDPGVEYD